jgi:malate synthase
MSPQVSQLPGVEITGAASQFTEQILTPEALKFVVDLERRFGPRRQELLAARVERQKRLDAGERPDFPRETAEIRNSKWTVAPIPADLQDRRVEITGPVDRKMVINALNSGANTYMADFEDANTPTWTNLIEGHVNLKDAIRRTIAFSDLSSGKDYKLNPTTAVLIVRPRGWHLPEKHVLVDGKPMTGAFFDFGLFLWHNAKELLARGTGPYFYLPKLESHLEARLWNDVFNYSQDAVGIKRGTIKGTVLIETILAAFEMDEILYELREHSSGLNAGRWDYIFSFIKKFASDPADILPDRGKVTMGTHFMSSYAKLLIKICHNREVHAMGGMSAYIPNKRDPQANQMAMDQVRADKEREATIGHDGTWVAHPGLVALAKEVFDKYMPKANQIDRKLEDFHATAADLLQVPHGDITEAGLRQNIAVGIGYMESWLRGIGCVPLFNLMEDAATAEISRAQLWQWVHYNAKMSDGRAITLELCLKTIDEELAKAQKAVGEEQFRAGRYNDAAEILRNLIQAPKFVDFLTLPAYDRLNAVEKAAAGKKA